MLPIIVVTLLIKIIIAYFLPWMGDESYYIFWGMNPALGYYDQPPMIGWWMTALQTVSFHPLWLRLPSILLSHGIAWGLYSWIKPFSEKRAQLIATLFLLAPAHLLPVILSTDLPLIAFGFLAYFFFWRRNFLIAGVCVGLAFLSKYFALLIPVSAALYVVAFERSKKNFIGIGFLITGVLVALGFHLHWNLDHCNINFAFNLSSRNQGEEFDLKKPLLFALYQFYLITPIGLWAIAKHRNSIKAFESPLQKYLACIFLIPLILFGLSSLKFGQGIHWMLSFYPAAYAWFALSISEESLDSLIKPMAIFLVLHLLFLIPIAMIPESKWLQGSRRSDYVLFRHTEEVSSAIDEKVKLLGVDVIASDSYTVSSLLSITRRHNVPIYASFSKFGREDDFLTDWRQLDGKTIAIFSRSRLPLEDYRGDFANVRIEEFEVRGIPLFLLVGSEFRFQGYRNRVLRQVIESYYSSPIVTSSRSCAFLENYH